MLDAALMRMLARLDALDRQAERASTREVARTALAEVIGTGASGVLELASIPGTFRSLEIQLDGARSSVAATADSMRLTFETSPTAGAYDHQRLYGTAATAGADENLGTSDFILIGSCPGSTATVNLAAASTIKIPGYANATWKAVIVNTASVIGALTTGQIASTQVVGIFESTAAITRVRLVLASGSWTTTSRATLYGYPA